MSAPRDVPADTARAADREATTGLPSGAPLRIGVIDLSFHAASSGVVAALLRRDGIPFEFRHAPHEALFGLLANDEIDLAISAWLPGSHGAYIQPFEDQLVKLGVLYQPYAIWGVPDEVPVQEVEAVADLLKPAVVARMRKTIQGIGPGAGISRFSREIMDAYRLGEVGYEFRNGSLQDCVGAFESAVQAQQWVVVPLWHPQFLHNRHRIRALREPLGLLRGQDEATLVLRRSALSRVPARTLNWMRRISLGNAVVAALDDQISRGGLTPEGAAADWMARHPEIVASWEAQEPPA
ncbi:glycine betaine ABC transporter substrate-binding protein [Roseateles amylovorans]|uniref:Glycine betaine ABC transporter substrate-binding protein n=1 Tax=Roseateles amylovorans TaxID=2978473 RepID=A0ABY6AVM7_9BURK|nr:glycine betaine ABC transporter substrate-binding protein [Roseateles amylovorans]UXH77251.1 glycine betaine ABC transporter substrate-binding protein [Roseateles amylovorans]